MASLCSRLDRNSEKPNKLADRVAHLLDLKEAPEPLTEGELALRRVEALERLVAPLHDRLSCFLSYRFAKEVEPLAAKLQKFLALLDIDVTTGAAYEPRPIVEKVKDRLGLNHGFVVFGNLDPRGIDVDERRS